MFPCEPCAGLPSKTRTPDMSNKNIDDIATVSRRGFLKLAGASGLATAAGSLASASRAAAASPDGTPEQIHLTWGDEPATEIVISWASLAPAVNPRVRFGRAGETMATAHGIQRTYTDGLN